MARKNGARPTIKDVARQAGVSIGTVSRVINDRTDVDAELRKLVKSTMRQLQYRPNVRAQSFVRDSSHIIGFVVCNHDDLSPMHALLLLGAEKGCTQAGYHVLFANHQYPPDAVAGDIQLPAVIQSHGLTDCAIVAGKIHENFLAALEREGISHVLLANNVATTRSRPAVNQVRYDDYRGAYQATEYLMQLGHKDIWYLGDTSQPWFQTRYQAYVHAMTDQRLEPHADTVSLSDDPFEYGHAAVSLVLEQNLPMTAILAGSDELAFGVIEGLRQHGLNVPRDVSVIGFEHQMNRSRLASLTSICIDTVEVGRQLARMAIAKIGSDGVDLPEVVVPTVLVKRSTCRPIRQEQKMVL